MSKIIAFAGKKQSGKNTCCNFIFGTALLGMGIVNNYHITDNGELYISNLDSKYNLPNNNIVDFRHPYYSRYFQDHVDIIKMYGFADSLKNTVCDLFEIDPELAYGTDEQKNTLTHLVWENMPGNKERRGSMTVREVLEFFGTEVMRKMYEPVWVNSLINKIKKDNPVLALIYDCRFDNEAQILRNQNSTIIKLTRGKESKHISNNGFINFNDFDYIIDNKESTIKESNRKLAVILGKEKFYELFGLNFVMGTL